MSDKSITKSFSGFEIKDAEKGIVEANVATLLVVDKEEDVILADAIKDGAKVSMSSYSHNAMFGDAPVGKGAIYIEGDKAVFRGKVFLSTARGRETFEVLKEMGPDQQWSFGFRVLGAEVPDEAWKKKGAQRILTKLDAFEVSPVMRGAGVNTRTVAVKSEDAPDAAALETARVEAEAKAKLDAETKAKEEAEVKAKEEAEIQAKAANAAGFDEFERFQRTMKKLGHAA